MREREVIGERGRERREKEREDGSKRVSKRALTCTHERETEGERRWEPERVREGKRQIAGGGWSEREMSTTDAQF